MSLASIAPAEKTENLVYLLFPTAIATAIAYTLSRKIEEGIATIDISMWPIVIGIVAPLLGIFLYELSLDEWAVKAYYRWKLPDDSLNVRRVLAMAHLILETWRNQTYSRPPKLNSDDDYIDRQIEVQVQNTISSYYVHRQFWHIRATIYLVFSTPLYFWTFGNLVIDLGYISLTSVSLFNLVTLDWSVLVIIVGIALPIVIVIADVFPKRKNLTVAHYLIFILLLPISSIIVNLILPFSIEILVFSLVVDTISVISYVNIRKHSRLGDHIKSLCEYYYWQRLVAMLSVVELQEKEYHLDIIQIRGELNSLQVLLNRSDTSVFFPLWSNIQMTMLDDLYERIYSFLRTSALRLWTQLLYRRRKHFDIRSVSYQLGWLAYYLKTSQFLFDNMVTKYGINRDERAIKIYETITKEYEKSQDFAHLNASQILEYFPNELTTSDGDETYWANQISAAVHILYNDAATDRLRNLVGTMVTKFLLADEIGLKPEDIASFLMRYAKERYLKKRKDSIIFKDRIYNQIVPIYREVASHSDCDYLIADFILGGDNRSRLLFVKKNTALFEKFDDLLWHDTLLLVQKLSSSNEVEELLKNEIIRIEFSRLFKRFDDAIKDDKPKYLAKAIRQFLVWNAENMTSNFDSGISNRLKELKEPYQSKFRRYWQNKGNASERRKAIEELRKFLDE